MRKPSRVVSLLPAVGFLLVATACLGQSSNLRQAVATVTPVVSSADEPVHIRVAHLPASTNVTVELRSVDAGNVTWKADAQFRSDKHGVVDVDTARAKSGSYTGVDGMGLVWSMAPETTPAGAYFWPEGAATFDVEARVRGHVVTETTLTRALALRPVAQRQLTFRGDGMVGTYWSPTGRGRHAAVLLLGGSEGGEPGSFEALALASRGYSALTLAYFDAPGLPKALADIPLEYFAHALSWLGQQPGVDPHRLIVMGASRGTEATLLTAAHFPQLVHAVVVGSPNDASAPSYPTGRDAAWTLQGQPLPYDRSRGDWVPPAAALSVELVRGPILQVCGVVDRIWSSCTYADVNARRLLAHHHPYDDKLVKIPTAGHAICYLLPYMPFRDHSDPTFVADQQGRAAVWPQVLAFLARASS